MNFPMKFRMIFTLEFDSKDIKTVTLTVDKKTPQKYVGQAIDFARKMIGQIENGKVRK